MARGARRKRRRGAQRGVAERSPSQRAPPEEPVGHPGTPAAPSTDHHLERLGSVLLEVVDAAPDEARRESQRAGAEARLHLLEDHAPDRAGEVVPEAHVRSDAEGEVLGHHEINLPLLRQAILVELARID